MKDALGDNLFTYRGTPGFKEGTTSRDAAIAMQSKASTLRDRVYDVIQSCGVIGTTPDEVAKRLSETVLAVRPRVTELAKGGKIVATGDRWPNDSGLKAKVWRAI